MEVRIPRRVDMAALRELAIDGWINQKDIAFLINIPRFKEKSKKQIKWINDMAQKVDDIREYEGDSDRSAALALAVRIAQEGAR